MNKISLVIVLVCFMTLSSFDVSDIISVTRVDPLRKVFPENVAFREMKGVVEVAAGEHAVFQYAVHSSMAVRDLRISCTHLENKKDGTQINNTNAGFVGYVGVGSPSEQPSHDMLFSTSGLYPDPIYYMPEYSIPCGQTQAIWVTVSVSSDIKPGLYEGVLNIQGSVGEDHFSVDKQMEVYVYPVVMEEPSFLTLNWYHDTPSNLKLFNDGKDASMYSGAYWKFIKALVEKMKEAHQNVALVNPLQHITIKQKSDKYSFDFSHFDKIIEIFQEAGITKMIAGTQLGDRSALVWTSSYNLKVPVMENGKMEEHLYPLEDEHTQNFYKQFIPALMDHLKQKGWDKIYYQHIADEPIDDNAESYIAIAKFIKGLAPQIKIIEACQSAKLSNAIDVWVPILNAYQSNYEFFKDRQKHGDQVWFYTCCFPKGEYVNRFIELPLIKTRLIYWFAFYYGATGYLHWGFNYWNDHPYEDTTVMDDWGSTLPGGDSFIVYPDKGKLNGSIRLEAVRDGIEDYTLLKMLEKKDSTLAHKICGAMIKNWDKYDLDPDHLRTVRHGILEELSKK